VKTNTAIIKAMETDIKIHLGKCNNCYCSRENNKQYLVMCYRLPVDLKCHGYVEVEFKSGRHVDLCFICIEGEFKRKLEESKE
jgi:hypothetical protein